MSKYKISDHAIVRYLERVMGFDTDQIRKHILSIRNKQALEFTNGEGHLPVDDCVAIFKNNTCITVFKKFVRDR